jgi:hypothetical protein
MTLETYTRAMMANFCIGEGARHGGVVNMMAIAFVLRNRVFAGWGDWLGVVEAAPTKRGTIYPAHIPDIRSGNVRVFLNRIDEVYASAETDDITGGALFYCEPRTDLKLEEWFKNEVLGYPDEHVRTAHIGPVWFFK